MGIAVAVGADVTAMFGILLGAMLGMMLDTMLCRGLALTGASLERASLLLVDGAVPATAVPTMAPLRVITASSSRGRRA